MCKDCTAKKTKCNNSLISRGFEDMGTCVADIFNRITPVTRENIELFLTDMCDGCRMKILCPHVVTKMRIYAFTVNSALKVKYFTRLVFIQYIQEIIKKKLQ